MQRRYSSHEHYPQFKMGNMDCFILSYAATCDPADVFATQQEMNVMNWYCSDAQARGKYPFHAKRFWVENDVELATEDGDLQDIADGVDLIACTWWGPSTWSPSVPARCASATALSTSISTTTAPAPTSAAERIASSRIRRSSSPTARGVWSKGFAVGGGVRFESPP